MKCKKNSDFSTTKSISPRQNMDQDVIETIKKKYWYSVLQSLTEVTDKGE
jgi:hypothetical protein